MKIAKGHYVPIRKVHNVEKLKAIAAEAGRENRKKYGKIPFSRKSIGKISDDHVSDTRSEISETKSETMKNMMKFGGLLF